MTEMKFSSNGRAFIESLETFQRHAYLPTGHDVWTIGYGHTRGVKEGDTCTPNDADHWLAQDINEAVDVVNQFLLNHAQQSLLRITQSFFDALVSLVFNTGPEPLLLTNTIGRALSSGKIYLAWQGFSLWINQAGHPLRGLAIRRAREMALAMSEQFLV
jgi:lysozyme